MRLTNFFLVILFALNAAAKTQNIRVLNWWSYTAPDLVKKMRAAGYNIDVETYKSNNVAVAKLINHRAKFDVAIVSNQVLPDLLRAGVLVKGLFKSVSRPYIGIARTYADDCLPYLWSATVFSVIPRTGDKPKVESLFDLIALANRGYKIGIIDDKMEVYSRLRLDGPESKIKSFHPPLQSFTSTTADVLTGPGTAAYGWHGEITDALGKSLNVKVQLPRGRVVEGYDALCIVNNHLTARLRAQLVQFVRKFSNFKNTEMSARYSQYFSPYQSDVRGLQPQFSALRKIIEAHNKTASPYVINPPTLSETAQVGSWWRKVRYEK